MRRPTAESVRDDLPRCWSEVVSSTRGLAVSLALRELKEERSLRDDLVAGIESRRDFVVVADARAQIDPAPRKRSAWHGDEDERQVLVVAHDRRRRNQEPAMLLLRFD